MIARFIAELTGQIISNLLLPPVALGYEAAEAAAEHPERQAS